MSDGEIKKQINSLFYLDDYGHEVCEQLKEVLEVIDEAKKDFPIPKDLMFDETFKTQAARTWKGIEDWKKKCFGDPELVTRYVKYLREIEDWKKKCFGDPE